MREYVPYASRARLCQVHPAPPYRAPRSSHLLPNGKSLLSPRCYTSPSTLRSPSPQPPAPPLFPRNLGRTNRQLLSTDFLVSTLGNPTKCIVDSINLTAAYGFCTVWFKQNKMEIKGTHRRRRLNALVNPGK
ncbi:hypothetical protein ARMGADRAFT_678714 [Armillaria gallica]|uniref:Uncharacterized protein n=1 Tax=Armillaria gallica TaxID=47427 RepID=A0A2H3CMK5_ARMGA|nr:hypothetical protein ARMGADRAFT_678714 [Armillaria gallica]